MHDHLHSVKDEFFNQETREEVEIEFWTYLKFWLSSLWVVCHAFRHVLKLEDAILNDLIDKNFKSLSDFRNGTYHYHRSPDKHVQFFGGGQLNWAEELQEELERYFSDYLVRMAEVRSATSNQRRF
jgi:hypothetical protein